MVKDGTTVRADYGNAPKGNVGIIVANKEYSSRAEAKEAAMAEILLKQSDDKEINMTVSKGHYINIGSIIRIEVKDKNIVGQYRVTSKSVSFSGGSVECQLSLNKKPIQLSEYI